MPLTFLTRHNRLLTHLGIALAVLTIVAGITGCGDPTWLKDAQPILAVLGASIASIGALIAGLTGNVALQAAFETIGKWVQLIQQGLADIETLVNQYKAAPNATLLEQIQAALADVQANVQQDFSNLGLPGAVLSIISSITAVVLSQLVAWGSLINGLKAAPTTLAAAKVISEHQDKLMTADQIREKVNGILSTPTGDADTDKAMAAVAKV